MALFLFLYLTLSPSRLNLTFSHHTTCTTSKPPSSKHGLIWWFSNPKPTLSWEKRQQQPCSLAALCRVVPGLPSLTLSMWAIPHCSCLLLPDLSSEAWHGHFTPGGCRGEPGLHEDWGEVPRSLVTVCVCFRKGQVADPGAGGEMGT